MKAAILNAATAVLAFGLVSAVPALSQDNKYQSWNGYQQYSAMGRYRPWLGYTNQSDPDMGQFFTRVRGLISDATASKAADPVFLSDLTALVNQYSAPASRKGQVFLSDNFRDGNYTYSPTWKVTAGTWSVDSVGDNIGLTSKVLQNQSASQNQQIDGLLGAIFGLQTPTSTRQDFARIQTAVSFPSSFVIKVRISSQDSFGGFNIVPYQSSAGESAYRLLYRPNSAKGLVLHRISGGQVSEIGAYYGTVRLEDGNAHELAWTRSETGQMQVTVDGMNAIRSTDTRITGNMEGLILANVGGSYWIREVKIESN